MEWPIDGKTFAQAYLRVSGIKKLPPHQTENVLDDERSYGRVGTLVVHIVWFMKDS